MRLARVLGPVWGAQRAPGLVGAKILRLSVLAVVEGQLREGEGELEAIDRLGAGPGELVLVAHGSRVRDLTVGEAVCDKDIVIAIVDGSEPRASAPASPRWPT